jgi:hypothetical protein
MNITAALPRTPTSIDGASPLPHHDDEALVMRCAPELRGSLRRMWRHFSPRWQRHADQTQQLELMRRRRAAGMDLMGIPQAVRDLLLDDRAERRQQDDAVDAEAQRGAILVLLYGDRYAGKTVSACRWLSRQTVGRFISAASLVSLSRDYSEHRAELYAYDRARSLVVDDLGGDGDTERHHDRAQRIICERFDAGLPTLITTGLEGTEFFAAYGDGVRQRLFDDDKGALIRCRAQ